eukprot:TRINITY_DN10714_c0_g1_i1.p1 TRINITY_DN10714_c0_g1~~TRINITY_DN10714_c0_g1_i1.p1  ORF type:complete len:409 (+),score=72.45 TRINITY_DN10714_c0_g1_i1:232-1458(+)
MAAASSASAPVLNTQQHDHNREPARVLSPAMLAAQQNRSKVRVSYPVLEAKGYEVRETIGVGGYSKVKLVIHRATQQKYAVKIISKTKAPNGYLAKFLPREISALRRLRHPHVTELHDICDTQDHVYLIMQYASRGDLLEYINSGGSLSEQEARKLFYQMLTAVNFCHQSRVIHRDLKCENMLLDDNFNLLVSDFGFATVVSSVNNKLMTHCGSYAYASPEILTGQPYQGQKSDVWSLGIILFAMTCGRLPYNDKTIKVLMAGIKRKLDFPRRISTELQDFIERILVVDPHWRATVPELLKHPWLADYAQKQYELDPRPDVGLALGLVSRITKPPVGKKKSNKCKSQQSVETTACTAASRSWKGTGRVSKTKDPIKLPAMRDDSSTTASQRPSKGWHWRRPHVFTRRS